MRRLQRMNNLLRDSLAVTVLVAVALVAVIEMVAVWRKRKEAQRAAALQDLHQRLCQSNLMFMVYLYIWHDLDHKSEAYSALEQTIFDYDAGLAPGDAPLRNFGNPAVRRRVADCVVKHPEIRKAAAKIFGEIDAALGARRPWRQAPVQLVVQELSAFGPFLDYLDRVLEKYSEYQVAFGDLPEDPSAEVDLDPVVDAWVDDSDQDVILRAERLLKDAVLEVAPLTVKGLSGQLRPFRQNRDGYNLECSYSCERECHVVKHYPIVALGINDDCRLIALLCTSGCRDAHFHFYTAS